MEKYEIQVQIDDNWETYYSFDVNTTYKFANGEFRKLVANKKEDVQIRLVRFVSNEIIHEPSPM